MCMYIYIYIYICVCVCVCVCMCGETTSVLVSIAKYILNKLLLMVKKIIGMVFGCDPLKQQALPKSRQYRLKYFEITDLMQLFY